MNELAKATKAIQWLRGAEYDTKSEILELQDENQRQNSATVDLKAALRRPASVKAIVIGVGLMFFTQMCGINVVIFYTTDIFNAANSGVQPEIATIIIGVTQVVTTFFATLLMDRVGRRVLLLISELVMAMCTILLGVYFFMADQDSASVVNLSWLPIVALSLFIVVFSLGFGPIPWLMMGELFATDIKSVAGPSATTFNWLLAFIVTNTFNNLRNTVGTGQTFWLFAGISLIGVLFVYFVVPETKGKSLADIQKMLENE
jgi:MFS family permease